MCLGACSVGNWLLLGVSVGEGLFIEETLTCILLSYQPRGMRLPLPFSNVESMCSTNWFDSNSLPDSFKCSPFLVNNSLLLTISVMPTCVKLFASLSSLLLKDLIVLLICEWSITSYP